MPDPVLRVQNLTTEISTAAGRFMAAEDISFDLSPGETLGVVGESGSGKTTMVLSLLGLLPGRVARVHSGSVLLNGTDIAGASNRALRKIRGKEMAVIFQDPMTSLNPVVTIGRQLVEAIRAHERTLSRSDARQQAIELLELVGVPDAAGRMRRHPHEFSGGMKQRAMIAMAIANQPRVLIADEPTTALDVTIQAQILEVLQVAQRTTGAAMILVTHDLGVVAEMANRVLVMYGGRVVESGPVAEVFHHPQHPYTVGLLASLPRLGEETERLVPIPGTPPSGLTMPEGCRFRPRCEMSAGRERCHASEPPLVDLGRGRQSACHFTQEVAEWQQATAPETRR